MKTSLMNRSRGATWLPLALAVFAFAGTAAPSYAAIVYNITNHAEGQNGWSVNGTITVSGTGSFQNDASAITAWNVTLSKPSTGSYQFTNALLGHDGIDLLGTLTASAGTLDFAGSTLMFRSQDYQSALSWTQSANRYEGYVNNFQVFGPSGFSPTNSNGWTIGTAAAVPEPSAMALLGLGTVGLFARRRRN
jgi:hypothetical protein